MSLAQKQKSLNYSYLTKGLPNQTFQRTRTTAAA